MDNRDWSPPPEEILGPPPEEGILPEELCSPPEEFSAETRKDPPRRASRLRKLLFFLFAAAAVLLLKPGRGAGIVSGPLPSLEPLPVQAAYQSEDAGGPRLGIEYAVCFDGDPDTVHYFYYALPINTDGPVYADVSIRDGAGNTVRSPANPDEWAMSRAREDYTLNVRGLRGDLVLTVDAHYQQGGEWKTDQVSRTVVREVGEPDMGADFTAASIGDGTCNLDYSAWFRPQESDGHRYDLEITGFHIRWYGENYENMGFSQYVWEENDLPVMSGDDETGYTFAYQGPGHSDNNPDGAVYYGVTLELTDRNSGLGYTIDAAQHPLEEVADQRPPWEVLFFNFSHEHLGVISIYHPEKLSYLGWEIWEPTLGLSVASGELTGSDLRKGDFDLPVTSTGDFYDKHMDVYRDAGTWPDSFELHVTTRVSDGAGGEIEEETVIQPDHEQGWSFRWCPEDGTESDWNFPGCLLFASYESMDPLTIAVNEDGDPEPFVLSLRMSIDGREIPASNYRMEPVEEVWNVRYSDGTEGVATFYYARAVVSLPDWAPKSGTVHLEVRQLLYGSMKVWTTEEDLEY